MSKGSIASISPWRPVIDDDEVLLLELEPPQETKAKADRNIKYCLIFLYIMKKNDPNNFVFFYLHKFVPHMKRFNY